MGVFLLTWREETSRDDLPPRTDVDMLSTVWAASMPFFLIDDDFAFHPKASRAGDAAIGLWTRAGSYCMRYLTDGFVSREALRDLHGKPGQVRALVEAGLWVEVDGGWVFHEFLTRNPSRAEVEKRREVRARAGRIGGRRSGEARRGREASAGASAEASASTECGNDSITSSVRNHGFAPVFHQPTEHDPKASVQVNGTQPQASAEASAEAKPKHSTQAQAQYYQNPLLTLAGRLTEVDASGLSASLPAEMIREWQEIAGGTVDLEDEARAYLARHGDTTPRDPRGAWLGWLRAAGRRLTDPGRDPGAATGRLAADIASPGRDPHSTTSPGRDSGAPPAAGRPPCKNPACVGGWLPPDAIADPFGDRAVPCPDCKPHLRIVPGAAS